MAQALLGREAQTMSLLGLATNTLRVMATGDLSFDFDRIRFDYRGLPWKKRINWLKTELAYVLKSTRVWGYPTHLQMEPASGCNLRCPMCYITTHDIKDGRMSMPGFKKVMDELGDYLLLLHFWGWGEPFLNPDIFDMVKYARAKGIKVITSTNGHLLDNEAVITKLIDSGLDVVVFALDGPKQDIYREYRREGNFDKALRNLRLLIDTRNRLGAPSPTVNLRMVVTNKNEDQIPRMKSLAEEIGVDVFSLKTLGSHDNDPLFEKSLPHDHTYRRFRYDSRGRPIRKTNQCKRMWNHPIVYHDGTATVCVYHLLEELPVGNAFADASDGFAGLWFSTEYKRLRKQFLAFRKGAEGSLDRCRSCNLNYTNSADYVSHAFYLR
jgi:MoaA/NifB/PqqE/SkfB family radical SAM enzyme